MNQGILGKLKREEETEFISLPKSVADKLKELKSEDELNKFITRYIEDQKTELKHWLESLDEDLLIYKGMFASIKNKFGEAKSAHLSAMEETWEASQDDINRVKCKVEEIVKNLNPIHQKMKEINEEIGRFRSWDVEKFVSNFSQLMQIMDSSHAGVFKFLVDNFKEAKKQED